MKTSSQPLMSVAAVIWLAAVSTTPAQEKKEAQPPAKVVSIFPDKNLEKAVRRAVFEKRDNDQPIVEKDVENISTVDGKGLGITDLTGWKNAARSRRSILPRIKSKTLLRSKACRDSSI